MCLAKDETGALVDLVAQVADRCADRCWADLGLSASDARNQGAGRHEADGVGEERKRRAGELDQKTGRAGANDLRARAAELELTVAVDEVFALDELREIGAGSDVEEYGEQAAEEGDHIELLKGEAVGPVGQRDGSQRGRPRVVGDDEQPAPVGDAVHDRARGKPDEQEWKELGATEDADLKRTRVEDGDRDQRQR